MDLPRLLFTIRPKACSHRKMSALSSPTLIRVSFRPVILTLSWSKGRTPHSPLLLQLLVLFSPTATLVISTEAAHAVVSSAAEKSASLTFLKTVLLAERIRFRRAKTIVVGHTNTK